VDTGQGKLDEVDNAKEQMVYRCLGCDYESPSRGAAVKHRQRTHHQVEGVNADGLVVDQIGKGKKGLKVAAATVRKVNLTNESGADIKDHAKRFTEPEDETLFIYYKGGEIQRFWDRFGDHESIYRALLASEKFNGSPAEFVDASARYMLAVAGYKSTPCIIPATMEQAYEETARLIRDGMLTVYYDEDRKMRLEINQEKKEGEGNDRDTLTQGGVSAGGHQHQPEGLSPQEGEEELGQAQ